MASSRLVFPWPLDPTTRVALPTFDQACQELTKPAHVIRFGPQVHVKGVLGGTLGGIAGGILSLLLLDGWMQLLRSSLTLPPHIEEHLWSPSAWGFVALGVCIGLLIGLAQVLLKEAWLRVETGFRKGREVFLVKPETTIGRAESCDIGLFGDPQIKKLHARIRQEDNHYVLIDEGAGTYVNDDLVHGSRILHSGDAIRMGQSVLRFRERQKQPHD